MFHTNRLARKLWAIDMFAHYYPNKERKKKRLSLNYRTFYDINTSSVNHGRFKAKATPRSNSLNFLSHENNQFSKS